MLKTVYFLLDEKDREAPKISGDIAETMKYIKDCGYNTAAVYGCNGFPSDMNDEDKATTLVITDLSDQGKRVV